MSWVLAIPMAAAAVVGFAVTRRSVPTGMLVFGCLAPASWWFRHDLRVVGLLAVAAVMIIAAHRGNLARDFAALRARRAGETGAPESLPPKA